MEVQIWQGDTSVFFSPSCDGVNFIRSTVTGSNTSTNMSDQASSRYNIYIHNLIAELTVYFCVTELQTLPIL